jgi:hypothetical protein
VVFSRVVALGVLAAPRDRGTNDLGQPVPVLRKETTRIGYKELPMIASFSDTDKHEKIDAPLHPKVVEWAEDMVLSARKSEPPEVVADFEKLAEMARGGR